MNYIFLELDTTSPQLEIHAPSYTTRSGLTPITIHSNEHLSSYQEVYIIDSEGVRHDLTFAHESNSLVGSLYLHGYPIGTTSIYVRLMDTVDNISSVYTHSFNIMESEILTSEMNMHTMSVNMKLQTMKLELITHTMSNELEVVV